MADFISRAREQWPLVAYFLVCLAIFFPVIFFGNRFFGLPGDPQGTISNMRLLSSENLFFKSPSDEVFKTMGYPFASNGLFLTSQKTDVQSLFSFLPFQDYQNYNFAAFFAYFFSATAMFLLAFELVRDKKAAFFAGLAYGFSPFLLARGLAHLGLLFAMFFPLVLLYGKRTLEGGKFKDKALFSAFLLGSLISDPYYVPFTLLLLLCLAAPLLLDVFKSRKIPANLRELAKFSVLAAAIFLLINARIFFPAPGADLIKDTTRGLYGLGVYGLSVEDYLLPSGLNSLSPQFLKDAFENRIGDSNAVEKSVFLGYSVVLLAAVGAYKWWRSRKFEKIRISIALVGALAFVFSMGGYWKADFFGNQIIIPLPGIIINFPFPYFRVSSRFAILVMLAAVLFAAYGLKKLLEKQSPKLQAAALFTICLFFVAEAGVFSIPKYTEFNGPSESLSFLKTLPKGAVVFYPFSIWPPENMSKIAFEQRWHGHAVVNVHPGNKQWDLFAYSIRNVSDSQTAGLLAHYAISYAVISKELAAGRDFEGLALLGAFDDASVYQVVAPPAKIIYTYDTGYYAEDINLAGEWRWMQGNATIEVKKFEARQNYVLEFNAKAFNCSATRLEVWSEEAMLGEFNVPCEGEKISVPLKLEKEESKIYLVAPEGPNPYSPEKRQSVSFAIIGLRIS